MILYWRRASRKDPPLFLASIEKFLTLIWSEAVTIILKLATAAMAPFIINKRPITQPVFAST